MTETAVSGHDDSGLLDRATKPSPQKREGNAKQMIQAATP